MILGFLLETSQFIYSGLLPLKIASDITDKKLKSFSRHYLDPNTHSFVGTVLGVLLGSTYISNVVIFSNLNFMFQLGAYNLSPTAVCSIICLIVYLSIAVMYKEIKRELLRFPCIRKCFPKKLRSYTYTN